MSVGPRASEIVDDLVDVLNAAYPQIAARSNSIPAYTLEELKELRCDVFATQLRRPIESRAGRSKEFSIDVVIQQQARTQEAHNTLLDLADDVLHSLLHSSTGSPRRLLSGTVVVGDGALSADEIYDGESRYTDSRFDCHIRLSVVWRP